MNKHFWDISLFLWEKILFIYYMIWNVQPFYHLANENVRMVFFIQWNCFLENKTCNTYTFVKSKVFIYISYIGVDFFLIRTI